MSSPCASRSAVGRQDSRSEQDDRAAARVFGPSQSLEGSRAGQWELGHEAGARCVQKVAVVTRVREKQDQVVNSAVAPLLHQPAL